MSPSTVSLVAASLVLAAVAGPPAAAADPAAALPPLTSGGGPIIGGGTNAGVAQQLIDLADPDIQQGDGTNAANFINAAAAVTNEQLAAPFVLLRRGLSCQKDNAGFGARAYRRADGKWGGAMLVAAKSTVSTGSSSGSSGYNDASIAAFKQCVMTNWRRAGAGGEHAMCNGGWETPTNGDLRKVETYYIVLAGTSADFCVDLNNKLKNNARGWP